jgi:hypothetical protein
LSPNTARKPLLCKASYIIFEDARVDIHNIFDLPLSITIGQFQIADLMFLRETRLTDADFYIFKLNPYPLTYDRGMNGIGPSEFGSFYPFAQVMTEWDGKDVKDRKNIFYGGFLGIDKICGFAEGFLLLFSKDAKTRLKDLLLHPQKRENFLRS